MKGIVFTEFIELVENRFGAEVADTIIETSALESHGIWTSVGTYNAAEMVQLIGRLSEETGIAAMDLLCDFGRRLFQRLIETYPYVVNRAESAFELLEQVESHIHVEVRKLYPDAELPSFECHRLDDDQLIMTYKSPRCFGSLAEGLIRGCADYFGEGIHIKREALDQQGETVRFCLTRRCRAASAGGTGVSGDTGVSTVSH